MAGKRRRYGWSVLAAVTTVLMFLPRIARAEERPVAIGFSNLVARFDETDEIGFAKAEYRVHVLEAMRAAGLNAVGAESLVFSRDNAERADLLLGGTVKELSCAMRGPARDCLIGIVWEVLNCHTDEVVYRVLARDVEWSLPISDSGVAGKRLVLGALGSLLKRPRFRALLADAPSKTRAHDVVPAASFRSCQAQPRELPGAFEAVANATVLVKEERGFGSGFYLGSEGLVLTAAHVVEGFEKIDVQERGGKRTEARVVRVSRDHDVALLSIAGAAGATFPCLELDPSAKHPGSDVYAIGAAAREDLAFSLTRGIVSGLRTVDGTQLIQTDASISPGNSGGPLLDKQGRVIGVVSRKLAGGAVEGVAFGVAIEDALAALHLEPGPATSPTLLRPEPGQPKPVSKATLVADTDDRPLSLDPRAWQPPANPTVQAPPAKPVPRVPPSGKTVLRVSSIVVGVLGAATVAVSYLQYDSRKSSITRADYASYRLANDVGWSALAAGGVGVVASALISGTPSAPHDKAVSVAVGPTSVGLAVRF